MEIDIRYSIEDAPGVKISQPIDVSEKIEASQLCRILEVEKVRLFSVAYGGGCDYMRDIKNNEKLKNIQDEYKPYKPQFDVGTINIYKANKIFPHLMRGYLNDKRNGRI
ncbi:hypothetical protein KAT36_03010 [Candidatus Pacearchaeota archaeon]|nr:hypothetical protein [Candidatus Pacearchaeota archaeon]